jgi:hypothetical protein
MECLYSASDCLNIVCDHIINLRGKANPQGCGKSLPACEWCKWFAEKGVPRMKAGAWMRPNPVKETGSGANGAVTDADVVAPRFLLLESDCLPLACSSRRSPVSVCRGSTSGSLSYHAWIFLNCHDQEEYTASAARILGAVARFGFDAANRNPSRLSRLPGALREVRTQGDGKQRLVYLNPEPKWRAIL